MQESAYGAKYEFPTYFKTQLNNATTDDIVQKNNNEDNEHLTGLVDSLFAKVDITESEVRV